MYVKKAESALDFRAQGEEKETERTPNKKSQIPPRSKEDIN